VSIVLAHLFLRRLERVTWQTYAGALLIVAGVALVTVGRG
jgi:drug/metabolite transporter (DMT)-like permease